MRAMHRVGADDGDGVRSTAVRWAAAALRGCCARTCGPWHADPLPPVGVAALAAARLVVLVAFGTTIANADQFGDGYDLGDGVRPAVRAALRARAVVLGAVAAGPGVVAVDGGHGRGGHGRPRSTDR